MIKIKAMLAILTEFEILFLFFQMDAQASGFNCSSMPRSHTFCMGQTKRVISEHIHIHPQMSMITLMHEAYRVFFSTHDTHIKLNWSLKCETHGEYFMRCTYYPHNPTPACVFSWEAPFKDIAQQNCTNSTILRLCQTHVSWHTQWSITWKVLALSLAAVRS